MGWEILLRTFLENIMALTIFMHTGLPSNCQHLRLFASGLLWGPESALPPVGQVCSNEKLTPNQYLIGVGYYNFLSSQSSSSRIKPQLQTRVTCLIIHCLLLPSLPCFFSLLPLLCCFLRSPLKILLAP